MKHLVSILAIALLVVSCGTSKKSRLPSSDKDLEEAVVIKNDSLEYEIIIYDPGFSIYLKTIARPENFYSLNYYEIKNTFYVTEWNNRAQNPLKYGDFYGNVIDYQRQLNYGLEVNYKLYNYFKFIDYKYGIKLQ